MEAMLGRFVSVESHSGDPAGATRMGEAAIAALTSEATGFLAQHEEEEVVSPELRPGATLAGAGYSRFGRHRLVRIGANGDGGGAAEAPVLLLGHLDTVWPRGTLERIPWGIEDGVARGPGVFDMKAGLVQTIWALRALDQLGATPRRPVTLLWTADEEVGSPSSRPAHRGRGEAGGGVSGDGAVASGRGGEDRPARRGPHAGRRGRTRRPRRPRSRAGG